MIYGILAGNKLHLSENACSLKENITLKKTIDRLSKNLNSFEGKQSVMQDYLSIVKHHIKEDYAVVVIDNSDIAKSASRKLEALSEIRDGSTGEITQDYLTIEAVVLSESGKMPLLVYEKVLSAAESDFVSETYENLCCTESLSENFSEKCIRTLDRRFDANEYYCYFLKRSERFVIRAKKNRNVLYDGKTCNIMDVGFGWWLPDYSLPPVWIELHIVQPGNAPGWTQEMVMVGMCRLLKLFNFCKKIITIIFR